MADDEDIKDQQFASVVIPLSGDMNMLGAAPGVAMPFPARALRLDAEITFRDDTVIESYFLKVLTETGRGNDEQYFAVFDNVVATRLFAEGLQRAMVTGERSNLRCDGYEFIGAVEAAFGTEAALSEDCIEGIRMLVERTGEGRFSLATVDDRKRVTGRLDAAVDGKGLVALVKAYHALAEFSEKAHKRIDDHLAARPSGPGM